MSSFADGNMYQDVFVFENLVYATEFDLGIVQVYKNRNNSLIKLQDIRYHCNCNHMILDHSIIVTNQLVIQCCAPRKVVSILDRSGELLRKIPIADISGLWPVLCQVDFEGNFLIADLYTYRLVIAHVDQPSSQWRVLNLPDLPDSFGRYGAVWFRHRLYAASGRHLLTFTPIDF